MDGNGRREPNSTNTLNGSNLLLMTEQVLQCQIDWMNPDQIREARRLLKQWAPLSPTQALVLLDARCAVDGGGCVMMIIITIVIVIARSRPVRVQG